MHTPLEVLQLPELSSLLSAVNEEATVTDAAGYYALISARIRRSLDAALQAGAADTAQLRQIYLVGVASLLVFTQANLCG